MDNIKNFYETEVVRKFMPKYDDKQKKNTGIGICEHILACGKTGSGKSNFLLNFLLRTSSPQYVRGGTYTKIHMCVKKLEPLNKTLQELFEGNIQFYMSVADLPRVNEFEDLSQTNENHYLIIFDDCINDKTKTDVKKINEYFTYGRSKGCHCMFLTQSFYQTDIFIRKQVSWVILNGITSNKDLKMILKDYSIGELEPQTLINMYNYCKSIDNLDAMKICTYNCPINKKFSRNFLEYLEPSKFKSSVEPIKIKNTRKTKFTPKAKLSRLESDSDSDSV